MAAVVIWTVISVLITANSSEAAGKKPTLTVTCDNVSRQYGDANPGFTVTYSGFTGGDDPSSLGGQLAFATAATQTSAVGPYTVTPTGLTSSKYRIVYKSGVLTVNRTPLSVTAHDATREQGQPNPPLDGTVTGIKNNDGIVASYTTSAGSSSPPGAYPIVPQPSDCARHKCHFPCARLHRKRSRACTSRVRLRTRASC
jgi:hypothetical protein